VFGQVAGQNRHAIFEIVAGHFHQERQGTLQRAHQGRGAAMQQKRSGMPMLM
jgi:hypothetical protein